MKRICLFFMISLSLVMGSCLPADPGSETGQTVASSTISGILTLDRATHTPEPEISPTHLSTEMTLSPSPRPTRTGTVSPTATITLGAMDAEEIPYGVNPLTGQYLEKVENLKLPPALVSITNFPVTSRPQAGLSFSPFVYEMYLGEGASRFLAVFYGDYPVQSKPINIADWDIQVPGEANIGPIRSGRLPYESLRQLYNGFLVFAGASNVVLPHLYHYRVVYNDHLENINNAKISTLDLREIALQEVQSLGYPNMMVHSFDPVPPDGGQPAQQLWLEYHYYNQIFWRYSTDHGGYRRFQSDDPGEELKVFTDRLNGEELVYENVVILFAQYHRYYETFFDIDLLYIDRNPALLFRDGQVHEIFWTSKNQDYENQSGKLRPIRFIDVQGNPISLKPGQTWVSIVQMHSSVYETQDTLDPFRLSNFESPGSGLWGVRFYHAPYEIPPEELVPLSGGEDD